MAFLTAQKFRTGQIGIQKMNAETEYLEDALVAYKQGNKPVAKQHLGAFVTAVEALASQGGLLFIDAKLLVAGANDVIAQL